MRLQELIKHLQTLQQPDDDPAVLIATGEHDGEPIDDVYEDDLIDAATGKVSRRIVVLQWG